MLKNKKPHTNKHKKTSWHRKRFHIVKFGFTLIELLVVIAIIGLMSSIVLVATLKTRIAARDSKRIADIKQLRTALEEFYTDKGYYPNCWDSTYPGYPNGCDLSNYTGGSEAIDTSLDGSFMAFLKPYLTAAVKDPINDFGRGYFYGYTTGQFPVGSGQYYYYFIGAHLEDPTNPALKTVQQFPGYSGWYVLAEFDSARSSSTPP